MKKDLFFMQRALKQAKDAALLGEVPVGAVVTDINGHILANYMCKKANNTVESLL